MPGRALCISNDAGLRRVLRRALGAAGATVLFADSWQVLLAEARSGRSPLELDGPFACIDLVLVDEGEARAVSFADADAVLEWLGRPSVVLLGNALGIDGSLEILRRDGCDHVVGRHANQEGEVDVDEDAVVVTSLKLLRGDDIFGLEKYLTWGVQVHEREVRSYDDKRAAIGAVAEFARDLGCRRQLVARIESVVDELLMNALYDAPFMRTGIDYRDKAIPGGGAIGPSVALLRFACDGRHLGVSVRDGYGELRKESILDHLARARDDRGAPRRQQETSATGGAGLGLYFILNSVTRFIANITPGSATEVIGLFDVRGPARDLHYKARTLSIFVN